MTRHCCPAPHAAAPAKLHARLDPPFQHLMPMTSPPGAQKVQLSTVSRFSAMVEQDADSAAHALSNCHRSVVAGFMIGVMMRTLAATFVSLSLLISPGVPAHAAPPTPSTPNANYSVFLQAIAGDGIRMDSHQAIREGQSVCMLMQSPPRWFALGRRATSLVDTFGLDNRSGPEICRSVGSRHLPPTGGDRSDQGRSHSGNDPAQPGLVTGMKHCSTDYEAGIRRETTVIATKLSTTRSQASTNVAR